MPYYVRDPKRDHNFDNHPFVIVVVSVTGILILTVTVSVTVIVVVIVADIVIVTITFSVMVIPGFLVFTSWVFGVLGLARFDKGGFSDWVL